MKTKGEGERGRGVVWGGLNLWSGIIGHKIGGG